MSAYLCRHCHVSLDDGDVFEKMSAMYPTFSRALEASFDYGWHPLNRKRFSKEIYYSKTNIRCPFCDGNQPLKKYTI